MKKCLLTGGSGFIGANLARRLIADNHEVHLVLRKSTPNWRTIDIVRDVTVHNVDLRDRNRVMSLVKECRPEWIFHLAAYGAYSWQVDTPVMFETNAIATANLIDACITVGFDSFIHAGSSSEYGEKGFAPREDVSIEPNSCYAVTKAAASLYCLHIGRQRNERVIVLRLYSVYGPFEEPGRLMPTLIAYGLQNKFPPLVTPDIPHDFIYVDDVVEAFLKAADSDMISGAEVFNVGSGRQTSMREIVQVAKAELGIVEQPQWGSMKQRHWDVPTWICNNERIKNVLGWKPRTELPEGFRLMVEWLVQNDDYSKAYLGKSKSDGS